MLTNSKVVVPDIVNRLFLNYLYEKRHITSTPNYLSLMALIRLNEQQLRQVIMESVHRILEGYGDVDTSSYICIGEIPYSPWASGDKVYILASPKKIMRWGEEMYDIRYCKNPDGSGAQTDSIPSVQKHYATIYPEYEDSEMAEPFLGKKKDIAELERKHKEFLSKVNISGDKVILTHNSSRQITDGVIRKGEANRWSNNTDIGIYFWASKNAGSDPSGAGRFTYYCIIPSSDLYDFEANAERLSLEKAMSKHPYVGQFWKNSDAVVVTTYRHTPIYRILDKSTGKWYDAEWNEAEP